jgi:hypothetical protein
MINLFYGGLWNTGGFHSIYQSIWARNFSGFVGKHSGGVSPFFSQITYDTDTGYDVPTEGGFVINASGAYIYNVDILHCYHGIVVQPVTARLEWTFIYDARFDQNYNVGVYIFNPGIHALEGVYLHDVWSASTGGGGTAAGSPPTSGVGLQIERTGSGTIKEVVIEGGQIFNSRDQNVKIHSGQNVKISGVRFNWANAGNTGGIDNIYVASPNRVEFTDCYIGSNVAGGSANCRAGVLADAPTGDLVIRNCRFDEANGIFSFGEPIYNLASSPANVKTDGMNRGLDDIAHEGVPSAANLVLSPRQYHHVTGTAAINNITPTWQGRKICLFKPDAGAWTITTAGNVSAAFTVNAGENIILEFTGNKWIGRK